SRCLVDLCVCYAFPTRRSSDLVALSSSRNHRTAAPVFVFDEIDAGIGGRAALAVGQRLARLARHAQVIVVTHLPQVAAHASTHRSEEHTSELQSRFELVCRLLL